MHAEAAPSPRHSVPAWRPLVTVNAAVSLDGRIAAARGARLRLSDPEDLARVHRMRADHDAILVGVGTVLADDPALLVKAEHHPPGGPSPLRVVLDARSRTPPGARVLGGGAKTVVYAARSHALPGAEVVTVPEGQSGFVALDAVLSDLRGRGVRTVMVEGGSHVLRSFVDAGYVDRAALFLAPVHVGAGAPPLVAGGAGLQALSGFRLVGAEARLSGAVLHLLPVEPPR